MNESIDKLTVLSSSAVQTAIEEYTKYYSISAPTWLAFNIALLTAAIVTARILWKRGSDECHQTLTDNDNLPPVLVLIFIALVISIFLVDNILTIINPKAIAIHQLITDAAGKK